MALFQKKLISDTKPLYTLGSSVTYLIIGLGNPGKDYERTRHNAGFMAVDYYAQDNDFQAWTSKKTFQADVTINMMGDRRIVLCKPATFMNDSGRAVRAIQDFYKIDNARTLAVYDELSISFGLIRARVGGEAAGHNGVVSLIEHIGPDFGRLRIGIGNERFANADAADFVLSKFSKQEEAALPQILCEASVMLNEFVFGGQLPHETRQII